MKKTTPESLNICIVMQKYEFHSLQNRTTNIWAVADKLSQSGHSITLIGWQLDSHQEKPQLDLDSKGNSSTSRYGGFFPGEGVKVISLGHENRKNIKNFARLCSKNILSLHKQNPFDIVHSMDTFLPEIAKYRKKLGLSFSLGVEVTTMSTMFSKLAFSENNLTDMFKITLLFPYWFFKGYFTHDRKILKNADGIFTTTPRQSTTLDRYYLYPQLKTYEIPLSTSLHITDETQQASDVLSGLNLSSNEQIIMTKTKMLDYREMNYVLEAFQKIAYRKPKAHLIVLGHGPQFKKIEKIMIDLALVGRVHFVGHIYSKDIPKYISASKVFINIGAQTSGFGFSLLEAMSQKKSVIGSELSPVASLIKNEHDGYLIRPADTESLAHKVIQLLEDPELRTQLGEQAHHKITHAFDLDKMAEKTLLAFRHILKHTA